MAKSGGSNLDRVLVLEMVRVTEAAAIAAAKLIGRGDEKAADAAAVEAMRNAFNTLYMDGTIVIGEGERDEAPMLYIGEKDVYKRQALSSGYRQPDRQRRAARGVECAARRHPRGLYFGDHVRARRGGGLSGGQYDPLFWRRNHLVAADPAARRISACSELWNRPRDPPLYRFGAASVSYTHLDVYKRPGPAGGAEQLSRRPSARRKGQADEAQNEAARPAFRPRGRGRGGG